MSGVIWTVGLLAAVALVLLPWAIRSLGAVRGLLLGFGFLATMAGGWLWFALATSHEAPPADRAAIASVPSESCAKCHEDHYQSWRRTYHRTMTRDATAEYVKADFNNAVHEYQGLQTRFTRKGDEFVMETVSPMWAAMRAKAGENVDRIPPVQTAQFRIDRLVGSHWMQECLHRESNGRYTRMPVLYHIAEKRWVHTNGAFLAPDSDDFWARCRGVTWNETCLFCHNTTPSKKPVRDGRNDLIGYRSEVAELGISCEACHGPGDEHVRRNHNPARRLALQQAGDGDPSIVDPLRLSVARRDEICARCHGFLVPKPAMWDLRTVRDPFIAGQELTRFNHLVWSEAEMMQRAGKHAVGAAPARPLPDDGRFWGDGTPLTTALEYNGMALSACYQNGQGKMSCLSCHTMHGDDPNFLLKPGMQSNDACYQCHGEYRGRLADHTRHAADSPGSLCANCHMPHQVYSLLTTHRSHRIQIPKIEDSVGTGKPHACNLCHLDKSLGWTREQLNRWPSRQNNPIPKLSDDEEKISSAVLTLSRGDARSRVIVAGAFEKSAAQRASGTEWFGPFLSRYLPHERYPAVRYLAHRGLKSVYGDAAEPFDYLARPTGRTAQLQAMQRRFDDKPLSRPMPYLPLTRDGRPDEAILRRLLDNRKDPDLTINE